MFKQIVLPILGVMAFIVIVGLYLQRSSKINTNLPKTAERALKTATVNGRVVKVEVADTQESRQKGLSGRTSLDDGSGMLFVFNPQDVTSIFWMKDMLIPLDIIWINDGKVVKVDANVQPPKQGTPDDKLVRYMAGPIDYVLEVPAGYTVVHTIQIGDPIEIKL